MNNYKFITVFTCCSFCHKTGVLCSRPFSAVVRQCYYTTGARAAMWRWRMRAPYNSVSIWSSSQRT